MKEIHDGDALASERNPDGVVAFADLLHERIAQSCLELCRQAHYKHAAREAMTQVELALKAASLAPPKQDYGQPLIEYAFGRKGAVSLSVPLGERMHQPARGLFKAVFRYYRNYVAHDGSRVDRRISGRILVLASELLDLLDASPKSLQAEGGPEGLVSHGHFESVEDFGEFLEFIDGQSYPEEVFDGLMESLAYAGFSWEQITLTEDLGLVEERDVISEQQQPGGPPPHFDWVTTFELTSHGHEVLSKLKRK